MKTALLLSGQMRDAKHNWDSIKANIVEKFNADVFISTWSDTSVIVDHRGDVTHNDTTISELLASYRPKVCDVEENDSPLFSSFKIFSQIPQESPYRIAYDGSHAWESKIHNMVFMYYKMWKVYGVMKNYEYTNSIRYDRIIRARFDLGIENFPDIILEENTIYVPEGMDARGGLCDLISVGNAKTTEIYCKLFETVTWRMQNGRTMHPESALRDHLDIHKVKIERFPLDYYLRGKKIV